MSRTRAAPEMDPERSMASSSAAFPGPSQPPEGKMIRMNRLVIIPLVVMAALLPRGVQAQATDAGIRGAIYDTAGAAVGGATVEARHQPTGRRFVTQSDATGRFVLLQLPVGGPYQVTARRIGYRPVEQDQIMLAIADVR